MRTFQLNRQRQFNICSVKEVQGSKHQLVDNLAGKVFSASRRPATTFVLIIKLWNLSMLLLNYKLKLNHSELCHWESRRSDNITTSSMNVRATLRNILRNDFIKTTAISCPVELGAKSGSETDVIDDRLPLVLTVVSVSIKDEGKSSVDDDRSTMVTVLVAVVTGISRIDQSLEGPASIGKGPLVLETNGMLKEGVKVEITFVTDNLGTLDLMKEAISFVTSIAAEYINSVGVSRIMWAISSPESMAFRTKGTICSIFTFGIPGGKCVQGEKVKLLFATWCGLGVCLLLMLMSDLVTLN